MKSNITSGCIRRGNDEGKIDNKDYRGFPVKAQ